MSILRFSASDEGEVELVNLEFTTRAKSLRAQISLRGRRTPLPIHLLMFIRAVPTAESLIAPGVEPQAGRWQSMHLGSVEPGTGFYHYAKAISLADAGLVHGDLFQGRMETYSESPRRGFHEFEIEFLTSKGKPT